jgi:hypothetical protein
MSAHKFFPGRAIALEALLDQLGILLQAKLAPNSISLRTMVLQVKYRDLPNYGTQNAPIMFPVPEWSRTRPK